MKALILVVLLTPALANAGAIYKCKDAKGVVSYQQTTCITAKQDAGVRSFKPVADAPELSWSAQAQKKQVEQNRLKPQQTQTAADIRGQTLSARNDATRSVNPMSNEAETIRRMEIMAGSREGRAVLRAMSGQKVKNTPAPVQNVTETQTTIIHDQQGNTYTKPPGSAFATDNRTGKQCFISGATIDCK